MTAPCTSSQLPFTKIHTTIICWNAGSWTICRRTTPCQTLCLIPISDGILFHSQGVGCNYSTRDLLRYWFTRRRDTARVWEEEDGRGRCPQQKEEKEGLYTVEGNRQLAIVYRRRGGFSSWCNRNIVTTTAANGLGTRGLTALPVTPTCITKNR